MTKGLRRLQNELMADPLRGDVMPACGGLRKIRTADASRGKGKRGGARVIYLNIPEAERIDFITIYGKDEKDDLSPAEKKILQRLAEETRNEALAAFQRGRKRK
ncbi:MAG: type II toxin-antitoxin system RelE/ParE family toxin [Planctomycetes bacterium]|nr:type II toxin-antitoxin system RelE/ParE family toxin [Planctomycetota bacterium]